MDDFSDDDFDDLNANALQELENTAIQFTQAQKKPSQDYDYDFEDDDLDDSIVQDELRGKHSVAPVVVPLAAPTMAAAPGIKPTAAGHNAPMPPPSSRSIVPRRDSWGGPMPVPASHLRPHPPPPLPRPSPSIASRYQASQAPPRPTAPSNHEIAALKAQIKDLETKLQAKDGEITIVRRRMDTSRDEHDRELQALKKQTAEQVAKFERVVEAAKAAERTATTELEFTRLDMREEVDRARNRPLGAPTTPRKNGAAKSWGVSDGFEDVEMAASPTKGSKRRNAGAVAKDVVEPPPKPRTPSKGKRKRPTIDSPIMALETHSDDMNMAGSPGSAAPIGGVAQQSAGSRTVLSSEEYLHLILNHSAAHDRPLAFDHLARFSLPSNPSESLAAILFEKLAVIDSRDDPMRLPIEFCEHVIHLWDNCKKEKCLAPITELISLVTFSLQLQTSGIAPYIAPALIPVALDSCYEVAIPRFNNPHEDLVNDEAWTNFNTHISTQAILSLLYLTALGCSTSPPISGSLTPPAVDFWVDVHLQFMLMFLNQKHPVEDFLITLRLLCTSVFPDSIGPFAPDKTPEVVAETLIERISFQLIEPFKWDLDQIKRCNVRISVLQTLGSFARSPFGLAQLALSEYVVSRLVILLCSTIDELYDGDMPAESALGGAGLQGSLGTIVSYAILLLHTIVTNPSTSDLVNVPGKLGRITGGSQKYLISLARLNFAEELVSEETAELAHELLELAVTSEEGEELGTFFGG